jgi:hypothetical protein
MGMALVIWSLQASGAARSSNIIVSSNPHDLEYADLRIRFWHMGVSAPKLAFLENIDCSRKGGLHIQG